MLLDDDISEDGTGSGTSEGDLSERQSQFKINEEYARRFEHNKKREELHRRECCSRITLYKSERS